MHEDYFSHAYLARYLGYLLVEGADLRTKGNHVYLKTLEGLKEIDLIVRCVDGRSIDPLELDPGGFDGPAGLMRVWRRQPRLIVNALGSALAQNRGLGCYLPQICERLLGEELQLPDAPRWWLGDPAARAARSVDNLDGIVIRKAQEGTGRPGQAALGQDTRACPTPTGTSSNAKSNCTARASSPRRRSASARAPVVTRDGLGIAAPSPFVSSSPAHLRRISGDARRPRHDHRSRPRRSSQRP